MLQAEPNTLAEHLLSICGQSVVLQAGCLLRLLVVSVRYINWF